MADEKFPLCHAIRCFKCKFERPKKKECYNIIVIENFHKMGCFNVWHCIRMALGEISIFIDR